MKSAPGDIYLRYNIANIQLFRVGYTQKGPRQEIRSTLYADDAAVFTHKPEVLQHIMAKFGQVAQTSEIDISTQKTEIMSQTTPTNYLPTPYSTTPTLLRSTSMGAV